ncbi:hypothetical protein Aperf_G00000017819 [Anoplocephala perfoliata]
MNDQALEMKFASPVSSFLSPVHGSILTCYYTNFEMPFKLLDFVEEQNIARTIGYFCRILKSSTYFLPLDVYLSLYLREHILRPLLRGGLKRSTASRPSRYDLVMSKTMSMIGVRAISLALFQMATFKYFYRKIPFDVISFDYLLYDIETSSQVNFLPGTLIDQFDFLIVKIAGYRLLPSKAASFNQAGAQTDEATSDDFLDV